jgi:hypothetical protein
MIKQKTSYMGSNDKGIYEVRLDNMIDYSLFQETQLSVLKI